MAKAIRCGIWLAVILATSVSCSASSSPTSRTTGNEAAQIVNKYQPTLIQLLDRQEYCSNNACGVPYEWISRYQSIADASAKLGKDLRANQPFSSDVEPLIVRTLGDTDRLAVAFDGMRPCLANQAELAATPTCLQADNVYAASWADLRPLFSSWEMFR